jgi:urease accessory protein
MRLLRKERKMFKYLIILNLILMPTVAFAHPGHEAGGFVGGFFHPFSGMDHMLAMLAVGIWAAMRNRSLPVTVAIFLGGMLIGGMLGVQMLVPHMLESLVLGTALLAALLVALAVRLPMQAQLLAGALFAAIHGMAHGVELPQSMPLLPYAGGFLLASALLLCAGWAVAKALGAERRQQWLGAGLASLAGLMLFAG